MTMTVWYADNRRSNLKFCIQIYSSMGQVESDYDQSQSQEDCQDRNGANAHVVDFRRCKGDGIEFKRIFKKIKDKFLF